MGVHRSARRPGIRAIHQTPSTATRTTGADPEGMALNIESRRHIGLPCVHATAGQKGHTGDMAEFLTTTGISYHLEEIIRGADERLLLISPFLKVNPRLRELLEDKNRMKIDIRVIYGKKELRPEENNWLESMTSIKTSFCRTLHAKCYLNEKRALLTSMNLYEYSQVTNDEMGILVSREDDPELYDRIYEDARRILRASEEVGKAAPRASAQNTGQQGPPPEVPAPRGPTARTQPARPPGQRTPPAPVARAPAEGFCIRCRASIPANPAQPYCSRCHRSWKRYGNRDYPEKHCHICGAGHTATLLKPACLACFRKFKDSLEFAAN